MIDGRDADPAWAGAPVISEFLEFEPVEGKEPRFRTEARIAYDNRNFYVFVRMYDPEPDKILKLLARRDVRPPTDQIKIIIDSYHDRRTAYQFGINPAGVKFDSYWFNDDNEDSSWDAVWDAVATRTSNGWTAEFRIPYSQLRFSRGGDGSLGFAVTRTVSPTSRPSLSRVAVSATTSSAALGQSPSARPNQRSPGSSATL